MRNFSTLKWGLLAASLLPAALHAQSLEPQAALAKALATRGQWAEPAADVRLSSAYAEANGLEHIYVQQQYRGLPVYNRVQSLAFVGSRLASHAGAFVPVKQLAALAATPTVAASQAVSLALQHVGEGAISTPARLTVDDGPEARQTFAAAGVARRDVVASLTWALDKAGQPHLAWNVNVEMLATPDWWNVQVDALTGSIIGRDNWTVQEAASRPAASAGRARAARQSPPPPPTTTTAGYYVVPFPRENPNGGFQTETDPWLKAGASNNAVTYGWHFDGTTNYASTRGNNVAAYDDQANTNAPGNYAPSLTAAPALSFAYIPDFTTTPKSVPNRNAAITNLFYWNNIIHDVTYQYGFTEAAGNYQTDNLGRGGLGGDYVHAEAQDGGGTNNANFSAPPDGTSGRMQMYLWDAPKPAYSITVTAPSSVAGSYTAVEGSLSANNSLSVKGPLSGQLQLYVDGGATTSLACVAAASGSLTGKIAVLYRGGTCTFPVKVKNAQNAGAIAVIVINNVAGVPYTMTGTDNTITIPAVMISQGNGATLVAQLANNVQATLPQAPAIPQLDGDFDNGVVTHEFGHGVSLRLTGGPANASCLGNAEQGGEGWSDYLALMLTTNWSTALLTDGTKARPVGTYVFGQPVTGGGIRRYPYSTSLSINPLTYANVASNPEVHAIGEIWCATLWDMTWNIIQQRGTIEPNLYNGAGTGGNTIALQLMMQGLKLQQCQPGFLDARDAILTADSVLYQGQYHCAIWSAFARRGMGYSAQEGSANSATDQTAAFDLPPSVTLQRQEVLLTGTTYNISFKLTSTCQTPGTPYTLTDVLPAGMQFVSSSTGGTLSGNTVTFSNLTFTGPGQTKTVGFLAQALPAAACAAVLAVTDNRDASKVGGFASQALTGSTVWGTSSAHAYSPTNAWYAPSLTTVSDYVLTSAPFTPTGLSTLSFYHYFDFEATYDGGTVELSSNNGTTWQDAGPYFVQNGYNSVFDASTTAPGQACFSGRSVLGATRFIHSVLDLRSFVGTPLRLRFRVRTDNGTPFAYEGWFVDDIWVLNGCGGNQQVELRTSAGALQAAQPIITYLLSSPLAQKAALADAGAFTAHPNPFGPQGLQLQLTLPAAQASLAFTLYDVTGRVLLRRTEAQAAAGTSTLTWPEAAGLPAGLYLVRLQLPDGSSSTLRVERE